MWAKSVAQMLPNVASGRCSPYDYISRVCLIQTKGRVVE